jgi:hypothetical protein
MTVPPPPRLPEELDTIPPLGPTPPVVPPSFGERLENMWQRLDDMAEQQVMMRELITKHVVDEVSRLHEVNAKIDRLLDREELSREVLGEVRRAIDDVSSRPVTISASWQHALMAGIALAIAQVPAAVVLFYAVSQLWAVQ